MSVVIDGTSGITSPNLDLTSGQLAVADGGTGVSTSTGTGATVRAVSPALTTPDLGTPSALVGTNISGTANSLNAGLGVNQTWQAVTRTSGTTYTNSTGKPIQITASIYGINNTLTLTIGGVILGTVNGNYGGSLSGIIPNGATYVLNGSYSYCSELR